MNRTTIRRPRRPVLPRGVSTKKRILVEGLALIRLLRHRPCTRREVEEQLGIPHRECYRYLEALRLAAAPLKRERQGEGVVTWRIAAGWPSHRSTSAAG